MSVGFEWMAVFLIVCAVVLITLWKRTRTIGIRWPANQARKLAIKDKVLSCNHCGCDSFRKTEGLINTSIVMLFHIGFWNRSAACYTCADCGFIHWFLSPEEKVYKEFDKSEEGFL